ncbi:hypothetical protein pb186bvf_019038 [Paramecium bursaria]
MQNIYNLTSYLKATQFEQNILTSLLRQIDNYYQQYRNNFNFPAHQASQDYNLMIIFIIYLINYQINQQQKRNCYKDGSNLQVVFTTAISNDNLRFNPLQSMYIFTIHTCIIRSKSILQISIVFYYLFILETIDICLVPENCMMFTN